MTTRSIRGCSVAVIGGAGFIGSHLVDYLIKDRDCQVLVIDNLCAGRREFVHPEATFVHADITDSESFLLKLFQKYKVEYVFNYASYPYVPDSFDRPLHVFNTNAMGAIKVINAAQEARCGGILQVSSAEIYGDGNPTDTRCHIDKHCNAIGPIDESAPVRPHSTYGSAKAAIDAIVQVRWKEASTPVLAIRQFNVMGERDTLHPYVVPAIYEQLSKYMNLRSQDGNSWYEPQNRAVPIVKLGNNSARDFQYVGDSVKMAVELLENGEWGQVYNSGSERSIQIYDLAKLMANIMGFDSLEIVLDPFRVRPYEIWNLKSDNTKLYSVIKYRPKVGLEKMLKRTIKYFDDSRLSAARS